jgi:hypothetical protein
MHAALIAIPRTMPHAYLKHCVHVKPIECSSLPLVLLLRYIHSSTTTIVSIPARAAYEVSMQAILFPLWNIHSTVSPGCHSAVELPLDKMVLGPSSNQ